MAKYRFGTFVQDVREDIKFDSRRKPALWWLSIWTSVRFRLVFLYRLGRFCDTNGPLKILCPWLRLRQYRLCGCEVSPKAMIGRRLQLPHPTGIVIGHGVTIEDDVTILQNVTLGHLGDGSGADAYPVIKSGSAIYAGAKIIGAVVVGPNAKIGANAVVLKDVPEGNAAIGVPAKNCEPKP